LNFNDSVYVVTPETTSNNLFLFRDNIAPMITGKNVMVLALSVSSGKTIKSAIEAVNYYGGTVSAIASIFSTEKECQEFCNRLNNAISQVKP
jgi:orotate phosphoribosyltransferase